LAIETGLLTPRLGILVFTVKAAITNEKDLKNGEIIRGSDLPPYCHALYHCFPQAASWLPNIENEVAVS
jgi:hypothetical protein